MNLFCRLFGHTWWPETRSPELRWNTTEDGAVLACSTEDGQGPDGAPPGEPGENGVRHVLICKRCGEEREDSRRRFDDDRPAAQPEPVDGSLEQAG